MEKVLSKFLKVRVIFPFILSHFSFVSNAMNFFNFFIHSLNRFVSLKLQIDLLNVCKLDCQENLFDFYVKAIAFIIRILP